MVALACYEYILTWEYEQSLVWRRKWTASTWLFVIDRYLMLSTAIISAAPYTRQVSNVFDSLTFQSCLLTYGSLDVSSSLSHPNMDSKLLTRCQYKYEYRCYPTSVVIEVIDFLPFVVAGGKHSQSILFQRFNLIPTAFSALPVFALWDRKWVVSIFVLLLNLAPAIVNAVSIFSNVSIILC